MNEWISLVGIGLLLFTPHIGALILRWRDKRAQKHDTGERIGL